MTTLVNWRFIGEREGFKTRGYVPMQNGAPLGQSGVTIGGGVDLGHWTVDQLRRRRVPEDIIAKVTPFLGHRGADAVAVLNTLALELSHDEAERLTSIIQGDIVDALKARYTRSQPKGTLSWDYMPEPARTIITSVAFQYGPALSARTPKFWRAATSQNWSGMVTELRDFGDSYPTRRGIEADYLEHMLKRG
jgi:hypothetical protein